MNTAELIANDYKIENVKIISADLSMEDHGCLTFNMELNGGSWGCIYGGYGLGRRYFSAKKFEGSSKGLEYIMRIMDIVGVEKMSDLKNKYIRVATKSRGEIIKIIGNIIEDKWFDPENFFKNSES